MSKPGHRRLRFLWIGLITWIFLIINAVRFIGNAPYQLVAVAGIVDFAVIGAFIIALRKEYRNVHRDGG